MSNKVTLITAPDDIVVDGLRILLVGLTSAQSALFSDALNKFNSIPNTIIYIWNQTDDLTWLFDKKHKSQFIIFNSEMDNQELVGYFSAQSKSHYFGVLRSLEIINNRVVHDLDQLLILLKEQIHFYEQSK
jgi:chromosome condensin MukBEF complex kleisin-like MukF subunit